MKNLLKLTSLFLLSMFLMTSCEEDIGGGGGGIDADVPPSLTIVSSTSTMTPGGTFSARVSTTAGDGLLDVFTIREDGATVDAARIMIDGAPAVANPILILDATDQSGFAWDIDIMVQGDVSSKIFEFVIEDTNDLTASESVTITTEGAPPSIDLMGGGVFQTDPGALVSIPIMVTAGSSLVDTIIVLENGVLVEPERLYYGDLSTQFPSNPLLVPLDDQNGFSIDLFIRAHPDVSTKTYTVIIGDLGGMRAMTTIDIETLAQSTPLEASLQGILFNSAGPVGTGGLNLENGESTGSSTTENQIRDLGIDASLPDADNWIKRVGGNNGFEMRYAFAGQNGLPEGFSFDGVDSKEGISGIWDNTTAFSAMDGEGNFISFEVIVGDTWVVSDGVDFFLVIVREINETPGDNGDNYVVDIKF